MLLFVVVGPLDSEAVAALLQPIQQTQQQQAQELSDFKVMLEELKGGHSEVGGAGECDENPERAVV